MRRSRTRNYHFMLDTWLGSQDGKAWMGRIWEVGVHNSGLGKVGSLLGSRQKRRHRGEERRMGEKTVAEGTRRGTTRDMLCSGFSYHVTLRQINVP